MKILHIVDIANPKGNGVAVAVSNYLKHEQKYATIALYNLGTSFICDNVDCYEEKKYPKLADLPKGYDKPDLIVFNEIYKKKYIGLYKECIKNNIPYVIIPHGCLVKNAQKKKLIKKFLGNLLVFKPFIKNAASIQFLNEEEYKNSIFNNTYHIISGNGVTIPNKKNICKNNDFVYIGRYDIKVKGLDLLLNTCSIYKKWFLENNVQIQLYGRTAGNGYEQLKKLIYKKDLEKIIFINDAVYGKEKEKVLLDSYAFIQVSRHEGQPLGIMEALSYELPCVLTYGTTLGKYVNENKCGIGINFDEKELFKAIKLLFEDKKLRNEYSKNGNSIIEDYNWDKVIGNLIFEYKKLTKEK